MHAHNPNPLGYVHQQQRHRELEELELLYQEVEPRKDEDRNTNHDEKEAK